MENISTPQPESPKWGSTTKLIVGLAFVALIAALLIYFRNLIGPLLLVFILTFLLQPVASWTSRNIRISWRAAVNLIYLILALILIGLITISGLAIVQQAQSLIAFVNSFINSLPELVSDLSTRSFNIGPFDFDFSQLDLTSLTNQVLNVVQPLLGQAGTLLGRLATSAATLLGWGLFILTVSYFMLHEGGQLRENFVNINIPGYNADISLLFRKLYTTWNAFLRGQFLISLLVILSYYILLTILGTRLTLVIAIMAGLARFIPWIGPLITWTVTGIVAFFQLSNYFGLSPIAYALLVIICCILLDQIFDNMVVPRMMGQALGLHPAAVLVAALVSARLIGIVGLVVAAPMLATLMIVGRYVGRKMFDLPPWPPITEEKILPPEVPWVRMRRRLLAFWSLIHQKRHS